ncbi:MAG: hypothetical protein EPO24_13335 [Bacteroidetes bacterium]|nr:MAG: hypothetical protein EPO24_13335 [Bacteroidota bacterium]
MEYIQIPDEYNARALWLLFTHSPTKCFPSNIYSVSAQQLTILRSEGIPFTKIDLTKIEFPKPEAAH